MTLWCRRLQTTEPNAVFMEEEIIRGRDAQRHIVEIAQEVSSRVRKTLGPLGFDMMLVDRMGEHTQTNDGATIMKMQDFRDPVAKMFVEVAKAQEEQAFDGTTTCVVLLAELLRLADNQIEEKGTHPNDITRGYREGLRIAIETAHAVATELDRQEAAESAARTALTGKTAGVYSDKLIQLCAKAAMSARPEEAKILAMPGETELSEVVDGVVVMKEPCLSAMQTELSGRVLVLDEDLAPPQANISLSDPTKIAEIAEVQENYIKNRVQHILDMDVQIVFCQKQIDSRAQQVFRRAGMTAFRQVRKSDIHRIAEVTGATVVSDLASISEEDIGKGSIEFVKAKPNPYTKVIGPESGSISILLYALTEQSAQEIMRALDDAIGVAWLVATEPKMVSGAGTIQNQMAHAIRKQNPTLDAKAEAAKLAFGEALMLIPKTLAESAGMDLMDTMHSLSLSPDAGVDALRGVVAPVDGVREPLAVVTSAMRAAVENCVALLRTHAIIKSKSFQEMFNEEMSR